MRKNCSKIALMSTSVWDTHSVVCSHENSNTFIKNKIKNRTNNNDYNNKTNNKTYINKWGVLAVNPHAYVCIVYISVDVWYREHSGGPSSSRSQRPRRKTTKSMQSPRAAQGSDNGPTHKCKQSAHSFSSPTWGDGQSQFFFQPDSVLISMLYSIWWTE